MVAKMKSTTIFNRGPSLKVAKARLLAKKGKQEASAKAKAAEEKLRKSGGYGAKMVSVWAIPPGGTEKSPAYRLVLSRCVQVTGSPMTKLPPAKDRAGAAVKGGFPLDKWPPNMLVDAYRAYWLPDDWAQAIKNTGPGGTYLGWVNPEGKFFYHRHRYPTAIEETIGRKLTALDGFNGILRSVRIQIKPDADKRFLQECLTPAERKHVLPAGQFHFGIVSARRATIEQGINDIMVVEAMFKLVGIKPTWYVDAESLLDYKNLGLIAKVGGKLTPARNMVLDDARKLGKRCVQVSDDIGKWEYINIAKQDLRGETTFDKANFALAGSRRHVISPLAAAQFMLAKLRSSPLKPQPQLAGVFPTANAALTMGTQEFSSENFILGDFFVADSSPVRFDNNMTLKEDYDFTCSHLQKHGSVIRCNRMFVYAKHATNKGGAVATRDQGGSKERRNIAIMQQKWPGVFKLNSKRKDEVLMNWSHHGVEPSKQEPCKGKAAVSKGKLSIKKGAMLKGRVKKLGTTFPPTAILRCTGKEAVKYISVRCKKLNNKTVQQSLGTEYIDASGTKKKYGYADLKYDISTGRLAISSGKK